MMKSEPIQVFDSQGEPYKRAFQIFLDHTDQKRNAKRFLQKLVDGFPNPLSPGLWGGKQHGRGKLLKAETYRKLHTPVTGNYALGWGAKLDDAGVPLVITHNGSNGHWVAEVRIMPKHDIIILLATNSGTDGANQAMKEIRQPLRDRLKPFDQ